MNTIQKRFLLFLIGCIGTRFLFVYLAKNVSKSFLLYMGYIALIIGIGFLSIYFGNLRRSGQETFGDKIWWNDLRPVHGTLYLLFAYFAISGNSGSWIILLIDVIIGLVSFLWHHYYNGNFNKLMN